jgi:hypothetical protein
MTTLTNSSYISKFNEKLKIYDSVFFKTIDGSGVLLNEASKIMEPNGLKIPTNNNATTYNTAQFGNFIRNIVNFNIKNYDTLDNKDNNMGFVMRTNGRNGQPTYSLNVNVRNNIIETLKVVNVFVDILEAYKYCIENKEKGRTFDTGYTNEKPIDRIELVSVNTRFYDTNKNMFPDITNPNIGYIRSVKEFDGVDNEKDVRVLFLSIQSFNTGMKDNNYNYNNMFTKINASDTNNFDVNQTNILDPLSRETIDESYPLAFRSYPRQVYAGDKHNPKSTTNLTLENRNKALVTFLLKTLLNLDTNFRTQSVYALYYYYKFVQLYSALIINVSNVMFTDFNNVAPFRIETRNMSTNRKSRGVSGIDFIIVGGGYTNTPTIEIRGGGGTIDRTNISVSTNSIVSIKNGGKGFTSAPSVSITGNLRSGAAPAQAKATIVPVVMDFSRNNDDNIDKLKEVINEISNSLSELITDVSNNSSNNESSYAISTSYTDTYPTMVSLSSNNKIIITINKPCIYSKMNSYNEKYDLTSDYVIYDTFNKRYYSILKITNEEENVFQIEINAVFTEEDIFEGDIDTKVFKDGVGNVMVKPAAASMEDMSDAAMVKIETSTANFLEIRRKDMNAYKTEYIYNRNDVSKLDENINFNTSKVAHQKSQYDSQFSKNLFLERQILTYNIILGIILVVLIAINVSNIEKQLVKTISLICLGTILLLFVIYFISNMTYIETFALMPTDALYDLSKANYTSKRMNQSSYNNRKVTVLKNEIDNLNSKFISYFEKVIITLPSTDNLDFYREIKEVISNDRDNKQFINKRLEYNKSQNGNDINSLKYELENNKLYISTLLISAIIFVGLYNLYINYVSNDRYQTLMIFICIIIFVVIFSYYIIASNKRVKTVFKNMYWGPESSPRF